MLNINILNSGNTSGSSKSNAFGRYRGQWNASTNAPTLINPPTNPSYEEDDYWEITAGGIQFGVTWTASDEIVVVSDGVGGLEYAQRARGSVDSVNGVGPDGTGNVTLTKSNIGLGNVDNTSDLNKPVSTATQTAIDGKLSNPIAPSADAVILSDGIGGSTASAVTVNSAGNIENVNNITFAGNLLGGAGSTVLADAVVAKTISLEATTGGRFAGVGADNSITDIVQGKIRELEPVVNGGSGYAGGGTQDFFNVPLVNVDGSGTGAIATSIQVVAGVVVNVVIAPCGVGYSPNFRLTANNANLGNSGSGFNILITQIFDRPIIVLNATTEGSVPAFVNNSESVIATGVTIDQNNNISANGLTTNANINALGNINAIGDIEAGKFTCQNLTPTEFLSSDPEGDIISVVDGAVASFTNTASGSGYVASPTPYTNVPLIGGSGVGLTVDINVSGLDILTLTNLVGGSGYTNGLYNNVPLTKVTGSGTGATAEITVSGGAVTSVLIQNGGSGYNIGNTLSALAANIGGTGSGFTIDVLTVGAAGVIVFPLIMNNAGSGYKTGDAFTVDNANLGGSGSGFAAAAGSVFTEPLTAANKSIISSWETVTTGVILEAGKAYIVNGAGAINMLLPAIANVGDLFQVQMKDTNGWVITQNAGQSIRYGSSTTTTGTGGSITPVGVGQSIQFVCTIQNTNFVALNPYGATIIA